MDKERLDWLEEQAGAGLVSDDNGHWAVSFVGMQNVPEGTEPQDIATNFFVEAKEWRDSIREAIDAVRELSLDRHPSLASALEEIKDANLDIAEAELLKQIHEWMT